MCFWLLEHIWLLASHIPRYLKYQTRKLGSYYGMVFWDLVPYPSESKALDKKLPSSCFQIPSLWFIMPDLRVPVTSRASSRLSLLFCVVVILSLHGGLQDLQRCGKLRVTWKIGIAENVHDSRKEKQWPVCVLFCFVFFFLSCLFSWRSLQIEVLGR